MNYCTDSYTTQNGILQVGWCSDIGNRELQEDSYQITFHHGVLLATVCDGMGGIPFGDQASKVAVNYLHEKFETEQPARASFYSDTLDELDAQVYFLKDDANRRLKAGTTIVSVMIHNGKFDWFSVGDSRIYLIRDREMVQVTRDHNYRETLIELLENGDITYSQFESETPKHPALTSFLGMGGIKRYEISKAPLQLCDNDMLLITSDGLYNTFSPEVLAAENDKEIPVIMENIIERIASAQVQGRDNTTFIIIKYRKVSGEEVTV